MECVPSRQSPRLASPAGPKRASRARRGAHPPPLAPRLPPPPSPSLSRQNAMSPAVASSAASSQRNSRGGRGSAVWAAGGGGSTPKGKATTAAASRFWVQTLNRERANELQLRSALAAAPKAEEQALTSLPSRIGRQRSYGLSILQQPEKARLSSFKDSSDTCEPFPCRGPGIRLSADHPISVLLPSSRVRRLPSLG